MEEPENNFKLIKATKARKATKAKGEKNESFFVIFLSPRRVSPFLAWGDFHARSRVARSTFLEDKWGTTRSLPRTVQCLFLSYSFSLYCHLGEKLSLVFHSVTNVALS